MAIQTVFRTVVVAKLTYAAEAWWGFTTATDRAVWNDTLTAAELAEDMDDDLFQMILWDKNHILHVLLPGRRPKLCYNHELIIANWLQVPNPAA